LKAKHKSYKKISQIETHKEREKKKKKSASGSERETLTLRDRRRHGRGLALPRAHVVSGDRRVFRRRRRAARFLRILGPRRRRLLRGTAIIDLKPHKSIAQKALNSHSPKYFSKKENQGVEFLFLFFFFLF
jgi:hypothetical protein